VRLTRDNPRPTRLKDIDSQDNIALLTLGVRVGPPVMIILMLVEFWYWGNHFLVFLIPDLALTALIVIAAQWGLDKFGAAAGSILLPSGKGTPMARQYSEQEALIIRGQYVEAADSFRAIIIDDPSNIDARMRLGRLLENDLKDPAGAEEYYRGVRGQNPSREQDWAVSNALIDLYQQSGNGERLKAELMRLARQYQGTPTGETARRRLSEL
jgi:tetratricopeptide (TPR) repeat protein